MRLRWPSFKWLFWLCILAIHQSAHAQEPAPEATEPPINAEESAGALPLEEATHPVHQPVAERLAEQKRQLLHALKGPPTALWLPIDDQQVLAFWQPDRSGKPLGAVLMLHDRGENPRSPATLRRLHEYLPLHGWATFSLELPDLPGAILPARPNLPTAPTAPQSEPSAPLDSDVAHQETTNEAPVDALETPLPSVSREEVIEQIHRRIQAATVYLHQQNQYNLILLGEGGSTHWVLQHLDKAVPPAAVESADNKSKGLIDRTFRAVVLVNPSTPDAAQRAPLHDELRHPEIPTLDVYTDFHLDTLTAARNRQQAAKQKGYGNYVIRRLPPPIEADPERVETSLTKTVRGFLQRYAQGVELE